MSNKTKKELLTFCEELGIDAPKSLKKSEILELIKQNEKKEKVKWVYHTSDIHIRPLERHEEYREVFDNLYKFLKTQKELDKSVFVICGDLFHCRDKLFPETIILFHEFIENLTSIIHTILIAGNHDTTTTNRIDLISGLLSMKNFQNLHYFENKGKYIYKNLNFTYLGQELDKTLLNFDKKNDKTSILLYHGFINQNKSKISNLHINEVENFDLVLLGDNHLRRDLTPTVSFCGSLIQQSHKEERVHGILKWNLEDFTKEFIPIENSYGFITLKKDTDLELLSFPDFSNIRLINCELPQNIQEYTEVISVKKELDKTETNDYKDNNISTNQNIFEKLIENYEENLRTDLKKLHSQFLEEFEENTNFSRKNWYINYIEFSNVFIYGNDNINKICFDKNQGIIGILGDNAIGKSSILNIILYCLFSSRNSSGIMFNCNSKSYFIKMGLIVEEQEQEYLIERKYSKKTETLGFYKVIEGKNVNISGDNKLSTLEIIHQTFNLVDKKSFLLTNVLSYSNYISLLNMSSNEIGSTFSKLFGLDKYSNIYSSVYKLHKNYNNKIKELETNIKNYQEIIENNKDIPVKIKNLEEELQGKERHLKNLQESIDKIDVKEIIYIEKDYNKEEVIEKLKNIKVCLHCCSNENEKIEEDICLLNIIQKLKDLDTEKSILESKINTNKICKYNVKDYKNAINKINCNFGIDGFIEDLSVCKKDKDDYLINKELYLDIIDFLKEFRTELKNSSKYINIIYDYENYSGILEDNIKFQSEIDLLPFKEYEEQREKILKDIEIYQEFTKFLDFEKNKELHIAKNKLLEEFDGISKEISSTNLLLGKFRNKQEIYEKYLLKLNLAEQELKELEYKEKIYKTYKGIINENCLPKILLLDTIKNIEKETNTLIKPLANIKIKLSKEIETSNYKLVVEKHNKILDISQISGYERLVLNLGLKLTLHNNKFQSRCNMFFIDEVFDVISEENFEKVDTLFDYLKSFYTYILVISHDTCLKEKIDYSINISTDYISSKITM